MPINQSTRDGHKRYLKRLRDKRDAEDRAARELIDRLRTEAQTKLEAEEAERKSRGVRYYDI